MILREAASARITLLITACDVWYRLTSVKEAECTRGR